MRLLKKCVYFSAVCAITWMATSSLIAYSAPKNLPSHKTDDAAASTVPVATVKTTAFDPAKIAPPVALGQSQAFAEFHLRKGSITVEDGVATATAHVSMADQRKGITYFWRLRVIDSNKNPLAGRVYDDQSFSVEANGQREVDFADTVVVPAGAMRVELVLFRRPPQLDLSFLNDDEASRPFQVIRLVNNLTP